MGDTITRAAYHLQQFFHHVLDIIERCLVLPSRVRDRYCAKKQSFGRRKWRSLSLDDLSAEIEHLLTGHLTTANMLGMSKGIRGQLKARAKSNPFSMLPSFNRTLPTGKENGTFLALDVGGSTFRVALVELAGRAEGMKIVRMASSYIDESVKLLEGKAFFAWMADKIKEMLDDGDTKYGYDSAPLPMGLSWSFPIDQTSVRSGRVIRMGKGFLCSNGTEGLDLGDLIMEACRKKNINVRMDAMVNDSLAALLSRAYVDSATGMSLILGTGTNSAVHFPIHAIGLEKFGDRSPDWFAQGDHVIINTELSMFGGNILPATVWDEHLNRNHIKPDYQPLEYMTTGRYLGEIIRLILIDSVESAGLFGGTLPVSMREPYSFDTSIAAFIQEDSSPSLSASSAYLQKHHVFATSPTPAELHFLQRICSFVSRRAAAYLAVSVHSLWCLRNESELPPLANSDSKELESAEQIDGGISQNLTIACDGSVINKYPGFRIQCQQYLDQLTNPTETSSNGTIDPLQSKQAVASVQTTPSISLDPAPESAIFGAAVAVAIAEAEG